MGFVVWRTIVAFSCVALAGTVALAAGPAASCITPALRTFSGASASSSTLAPPTQQGVEQRIFILKHSPAKLGTELASAFTPLKVVPDAKGGAHLFPGNGRALTGVAKQAGINNHGLYFTSRKTVVKLLLNPVEGWQWEMLGEKVLRISQAEKLGGPRLEGFGMAETPKGKKFYVELEELFPGTESAGFKSGFKMEEMKKNREAFFRFFIDESPGLVSTLARKYIEVFEHGLIPADVDFRVTGNGGFRWVDCDDWKTGDAAALLREATALISSGTFKVGGLNKKLRDAFLKAVAESRRITESDRRFLAAGLARIPLSDSEWTRPIL